jgi:hypothetical protein
VSLFGVNNNGQKISFRTYRLLARCGHDVFAILAWRELNVAAQSNKVPAADSMPLTILDSSITVKKAPNLLNLLILHNQRSIASTL